MISGNNRLLPTLALLLLAPLAWCAAPERQTLQGLLTDLARPAPSSTPFVEAHFSPLLARPLVVAGTLEYLGPGKLARTVQAPYHERSEIDGDEATVARAGEPARRFSLARAPQMQTLVASFAGLLSGNAATLERNFTLDLHGDASHWLLGLVPLNPQVRAAIRSIAVSGSGSQPRCLTTFQANDDTTILLLDRAARAPRPAAPDRAWFETQCQGRNR
ncbi:MAG TPA: LolA-related protein [Steroidobacteraceae bacterium]|nr:LolA-related protein [Steroidobacteraceae bacterium]